MSENASMEVVNPLPVPPPTTHFPPCTSRRKKIRTWFDRFWNSTSGSRVEWIWKWARNFSHSSVNIIDKESFRKIKKKSKREIKVKSSKAKLYPYASSIKTIFWHNNRITLRVIESNIVSIHFRFVFCLNLYIIVLLRYYSASECAKSVYLRGKNFVGENFHRHFLPTKFLPIRYCINKEKAVIC